MGSSIDVAIEQVSRLQKMHDELLREFFFRGFATCNNLIEIVNKFLVVEQVPQSDIPLFTIKSDKDSESMEQEIGKINNAVKAHTSIVIRRLSVFGCFKPFGDNIASA